MPPAGKKAEDKEETLTAPRAPEQRKPPGNGGGTDPPPTGVTQFRYIGDHAQILENGQPLGHGDYVTIQPEDMVGINQMLWDDGNLIDATGIDISGDQPQAASQEAPEAPDIKEKE